MRNNGIARFGLLLALVGCDELADEQTTGVALATLEGTLSLEEGVKLNAKRLHVSVIWQDPNPKSSDGPTECGLGEVKGWRYETRLLEQGVQVDTEFPSRFSVSLNEPPPRAAIREVHSAGASVAYGNLVVYDDRNRNGRLDPSAADGASPDQILGSSQGTTPWAAEQYSIVYLNRDLDAMEGESTIGDGKAGYSFETLERAPGQVRAERLSDAKIDLTLDPTAYAQRSACSVTCDVDQPPECPDQSAMLLEHDLGIQQPTNFRGSSSWILTDGDKTVYTQTRCSRNVAHRAYIFEYESRTTEGCMQTSNVCTYLQVSNSLADVTLPCTEYEDEESQPGGPVLTPPTPPAF